MKSRQLSTLESALVRAGASLVSGRGPRASLLVLMFHRVLPAHDPMLPTEPDAIRFAACMDLLAQNFTVLPLRDGVEQLRKGTLPTRAVCITFDDGYANNFTVAMPILRERALAATVFVAPAYLNGGRMFNDTVLEALRGAPVTFDLSNFGMGRVKLTNMTARIHAAHAIIDKFKYLSPAVRDQCAALLAETAGCTLPANLMMTDAQVAEMARNGIEIGAHTMTHPILAQIDETKAKEEIVQGKQRLEVITGTQIVSFAYPNGRPNRDYTLNHVDIIRNAGFELAVSTSWGAASQKSDPFQVPRIAPWDSGMLRYAARMINAYRARSYEIV